MLRLNWIYEFTSGFVGWFITSIHSSVLGSIIWTMYPRTGNYKGGVGCTFYQVIATWFYPLFSRSAANVVIPGGWTPRPNLKTSEKSE